MSRDWMSELDPESREEWDAFVQNVRTDALVKIADSAFVMSLVPRDEPDIKFAVELGLAIMLDKPLIAIVQPGQPVPTRLRMVCDEVVEADLDLEEGRQQIAAALARITKRET